MAPRSTIRWLDRAFRGGYASKQSALIPMAQFLPLQCSASWLEVRSEPTDWDALGQHAALEMLYQLHLVRAFEETGIDLINENLVHGPWHSSIGQEGAAVGVMSVLESTDQMAASHRGHHHFLAKALRYVESEELELGDDLVSPSHRSVLHRTLSEILGLADGYCRGRGGSMHLRWADAGAIGSNAIVGGGVPFAVGVAWAKKRLGTRDVVISFFGDGGINSGTVMEAMNLAALYRLPICFFIENNQYAIATALAEASLETRLSSRGGAFGIPSFRVNGMDPVAVRIATAHALEIMRAGEGPTVIESEVYRFYHHSGPLRGSAFGYRSKQEEEEWRLRDPLRRVSAEMIARKWITERDDALVRGQCKEAMAATLDDILEPEGNGRRIKSTLWPDRATRDFGQRSDGSELQGVRYEELETFTGELTNAKFINVIAETMARRMKADSRIVVFGEDIHRLKGGTNGATKGLAEQFPTRIIATPISEAAFLGMAGGAATEGNYRPVVELMYADFVLVAADQAFNQIAKARPMFGGDTDVPLVVRAKVAMGGGYGSQHSMDPAGLFANWPGWRIVAASNPFDYVGLMNTALLSKDPVLVIEHLDLYTSTGPAPAQDYDYYIPFAKAKVVRAGNAFTVLTYLSMVREALRVADELGIDAEIVDLRSLDRAGIDWETIAASVRKTHNVVVLEQGPLVASYGAMLVDEIQNHLFDELDQPVKRIHGGNSSPAVSASLEPGALVGPAEIRAGFLQMLADQGNPLPIGMTLPPRNPAWAG